MDPARRCFDTQLLLADPARAVLHCDGGCCSLILGASAPTERRQGHNTGAPQAMGQPKRRFFLFTLHKLLVVRGTQGMAGKRSYAQGQELSSLPCRASFPLDLVKIPHLTVLLPTCQLE